MEAAKKILQSPAKKNVAKPLFPWRHEDTLPPRLLERKANFHSSYLSYDLHAYYVSLLTAKVYLKLPWVQMLGTSWSSELADSCGWAFMQGVSGIVSNIYNGTFFLESQKAVGRKTTWLLNYFLILRGFIRHG